MKFVIASLIFVSSVALADDPVSPYPTPTPVTTPTTPAPAAKAEVVAKVVVNEAGLFLTNSEGLSLYTFDVDLPNQSNCYDDCAVAWPPVLSQQTILAAPFGLTKRTDGTQQVTLKGKPLYLFVSDKELGDTKGEGLGGVWHLARP